MAEDKKRFEEEAKLKAAVNADFARISELSFKDDQEQEIKDKEAAQKLATEAARRQDAKDAATVQAEADAEKAAAQEREEAAAFDKKRRAEIESILADDKKAMEDAQANIVATRAVQKLRTSDAEYWTANMPEHIVNHYDGWDLIPKGERATNLARFPDLVSSINPDERKKKI